MPGTLVDGTWLYDPTLHAPEKYKRGCRYKAFVPDTLAALDVSANGDLMGLVAETENALRTLNEESPATLGLLVPLSRLLLRSESIASSKVEGLQLGARELARAEAKLESGGVPGPTALEIIANIDAMMLAMDEATEAHTFGVAEICNIHRRLLERGTQRDIAGVLRTRQNWIGGNDYNPCGAAFIPPPPEDVPRLLDDLCAAINEERLPPTVQAALVHAQFETIHPFDDGNGRTGRAIIHVVLRRRGMASRFVPPVSIVFAGARDRYIAGLTKFRGDTITEWIDYFAASAYRAAQLAQVYVRAVRRLQDSWRDTLGQQAQAPRADATAWALIDTLPAYPMISGPVATAATGRSKVRVNEAIEQLVAAGILLPITTGRRNRWWEAAGLMDVIERLDAGLPPDPSSAGPAPATPRASPA